MNATRRNLEYWIVDLAAGVLPWIVPIPTAFIIGRASISYLSFPWWAAWAAALGIEGMGFITTNTALTLRQYNASKRKSDPDAPFWLAATLVGFYIIIACVLTLFLDVNEALRRYAAVIFPFLSLAAMVAAALRHDHKRRLLSIAEEKAERKMHKESAQNVQMLSAQSTVELGNPSAQKSAQITTLAAINRTRKAQRDALVNALLKAYQNKPDLGATEAARLLGVHRNTIYNYTDTLISAGQLHKNGNGWEVER